MNLKEALFFSLKLAIGFVVGVLFMIVVVIEPTPEPEIVGIEKTDTLYLGYVDTLSVNGRKWDDERDYGFDRIFPIYHYKIIRVSGLCGAKYSEYNPVYGPRECGFIYFDEDIKSNDKATMNIYQCYDTTFDTTCYQIEDCEVQDEIK